MERSKRTGRVSMSVAKALLTACAMGHHFEQQLGTHTRVRVSFPQVNPVRASQVGSAAKVQRHIFCKWYEGCLNSAIREDWPGFSCSQCSSYTAVEEELGYWLSQGERAGRLLNEIFFYQRNNQAARKARKLSQRRSSETHTDPPPLLTPEIKANKDAWFKTLKPRKKTEAPDQSRNSRNPTVSFWDMFREPSSP